MKILVLSDSHRGMGLMRLCIRKTAPDAVIHLGDYFSDGEAMAEENPGLPFYQVPGNCDAGRCPPFVPEVLISKVCGVRCYMTHGHRHYVKRGIGALTADAGKAGAAIALFGHTHRAFCQQMEDGLWVLNPGTCSSMEGTAALLEAEDGRIRSARILTRQDLEGEL